MTAKLIAVGLQVGCLVVKLIGHIVMDSKFCSFLIICRHQGRLSTVVASRQKIRGPADPLLNSEG